MSISTAGKNRYLLHFNSHHSLVQWTAGIKLAIFEHSTLQEAYTGALIAGKGKTLNNINLIMDRTRFKLDEWVRVRFGAGVPWRRCYCVISPPDEKEVQRVHKEHKKRMPYDRHPPVLKGDIKFYDSKKEADKKKKARPIATITDAYAAYGIYPQSKALIDGSTLLKVEGQVTIHSDPPSSTEGFVFIMPESRPAVSGFEMLLRFLFPTWDTFALYGRPGRLAASVLDKRSLMFGMPKHRRYGHLEILDVAGLISTDGSAQWSLREWRKQLKDLTSQRMTAIDDGAPARERSGSNSSKRLSFGPQSNSSSRPRVGFAEDGASVRSSRSMSLIQADAPALGDGDRAQGAHHAHARNVSDSQVFPPPMADHDFGHSPGPGMAPQFRAADRGRPFATDLASTPERVSSEDEHFPGGTPPDNFDSMQRMQTPEPVNAPPAFSHGAGSRPAQQPFHTPEMRRATSRLSSNTLSQMAKAGALASGGTSGAPDVPDGRDARNQPTGHAGPGYAPGQTDPRGPSVQPQQANANIALGMSANYNGSREALTSPHDATSPRSPGIPPHPPSAHTALNTKRSRSPLPGPQTGPIRPHDVAAPPPNSRACR